MTYVPHYRLSMLGILGSTSGSEQFSMSLALAKPGGLSFPESLLDPNDDVWDDVAADCAAWFARPATQIQGEAVLKRVKIAPIGADGLYAGAPVERSLDVMGGNQGNRPPNQIARAVTLHTEGDLGRISGRFYVPLNAIPVEADGRHTAAAADAAEASDRTFIYALNNQPGLDVLNLRVCVASQGRRNSNGSLRVQPANHPVTAISVGRVPDTIRRRRNRLFEGRSRVSVS